jgi:type IV pilus assembly protein PilB
VNEVMTMDIPSMDVPSMDVPSMDVPSIDVPSMDVPSIDVPSIDVPEDNRDLFAQHVPLGEQLIRSGLATAAEVGAALEEQRRTGKRLGETLIAQGVLHESDLASELASMFGIPYRDLVLAPPEAAALDNIPRAFCLARRVLPVGIEDGAVVVALVDPRDMQTIDDLKMLSPLPVRLVVVAPDQLRRAIERSFDDFELVAEVEAPRTAADVPLSVDSNATPTSVSDIASGADRLDTEGPVINFVNQLLRRAVDERASDIHFEPTEGDLRVRFRVDGILHDATIAPASLAPDILSRVKIMAGMDIANRRRPQDGRISIIAHGLRVDVRAASLPTIDGEALVLRLLQKDQSLLDIATLGFQPNALSRYRASFEKAWGMVLVTGPTGSGKTTTLYATVNALNESSRNIITVEDPIEYRIAGIKQSQVNTKAGYTFATGLRAALRIDPDVILIGEIRDLETAKISAESALTGHLVLSTVHANNASASTTRLLDMGLEPYMVTSVLECVVAQRLLRRLCQHCAVAEPASPEELLELSTMSLIEETDETLIVRRAKGCARCSQRGYVGRFAVQEVLVMDDALKTLVLERAPANAIAAAAKSGGMRTLLQDAFAKVREGETTLEECRRVLL